MARLQSARVGARPAYQVGPPLASRWRLSRSARCSLTR